MEIVIYTRFKIKYYDNDFYVLYISIFNANFIVYERNIINVWGCIQNTCVDLLKIS